MACRAVQTVRCARLLACAVAGCTQNANRVRHLKLARFIAIVYAIVLRRDRLQFGRGVQSGFGSHFG